MASHPDPLISYRRLRTLEVKVGDLLLGNLHPIRVQTMTTTDTMDTLATVEQSIRCIEAGAELVRITAPSKKEAENLLPIKNELRRRGYATPLVADIHFTPNAAEIAARIVEKVRVNPGNYVDKKKFEFIDYTDADYEEEIERIRQRFTPLVKICKEYGTAMRIGTNHGSLSDRIMSRYGDTPMGMVESAMEFLRVARGENYHQVILSMKSSNPRVMVQAYRLLIRNMEEEFGVCYPLHLGVTEAGDGEDGRIKSAIGIGSLLEDGIGDTIRVSLTEDPEFEIPVCQDLVKRYEGRDIEPATASEILIPSLMETGIRKLSRPVAHIGGEQVPVVVADFEKAGVIERDDLRAIGYTYDEDNDKWNISDAAADYLYSGAKTVGFALPGTLKVICDHETWAALPVPDRRNYFPLHRGTDYLQHAERSAILNFVSLDLVDEGGVIGVAGSGGNREDRGMAGSGGMAGLLAQIAEDATVVLCLRSSHPRGMPVMRQFIMEQAGTGIHHPLILGVASRDSGIDEPLIHFSIEAGALLLDGMGDGIWLVNDAQKNNHQFLNNTSFSILQATRTRISKTEYISCPSCGRTLFDLQETTARIRSVTHHLKGVKIAIMGCIVNGPGEMADADFGYVGSGPGKITLYKGKEVVKKGVDSAIAVEELINLLKESDAWIDPVLTEKIIQT